MVTKEEMKGKKAYALISDSESYRVTREEMAHFNRSIELSDSIGDILSNYASEHKLRPKYEKLAELMQMDDKRIKESINGSRNITRAFLYKMTVGLHMSLEEADKLFALCGGTLKYDCTEDYICIKALIDGDDILDFIDQYNHYTTGKQMRKLSY